MSKVNMSKQLTSLDGGNVTDQEGLNLNIGTVLSDALATVNVKDLTPVQAVERYTLAKRFRKGGDQEIDSEEVTLCKECIVKAYSPVVSGQVILTLEGK